MQESATDEAAVQDSAAASRNCGDPLTMAAARKLQGQSGMR
jgi:hypothetical protein